MSEVFADDDVSLLNVHMIDPTHFEVDLTADQVFALAASTARFNVGSPGQHRRQCAPRARHQEARAHLKRSESCVAFAELHDHNTVLSARTSRWRARYRECGEAIRVNACQGQVGVTIDATGDRRCAYRCNDEAW